MISLYIILFLASCFLISWSGSRLVMSLIKISRFLRWREFVVAFFLMSFATSLPNLFIGLNAAFHKIPQLSFGDIIGGNIVDLTLAIGLAVIMSSISLPAESKLAQKTAIFTSIIVLLPLLLIFDGKLSRFDGLILILAFFVYALWLFTKEERFKKIYRGRPPEGAGGKMTKKEFTKSVFGFIFFLCLLLISSEGIIISAQVFSSYFNLALPVVGMLIVGLGNCAPETYFCIASARKNQNWMILGNLMGSVIVCSTLVLGLVAIICPIVIIDFSPFAIARAFTFIAALFFILMLRSGNRIDKKEAVLMIMLYFAFLITEIYLR